MIEPTGPLPPSVYWRRRALAAGGAVLALVVLVWVVRGLVGSDDENPVRDAGAAGGLTTPPGSGTASPASSSAQTSGPSSAPPAPAPGSGSASAPPPATPAAPPPDPSLPCPDAVILVAAEAGAPAYRVGQRPVLRLFVTNTGPVPCTREISRKLRELVVTTADGATRVWSSIDCYPPPAVDSRVLKPGERLSFELTWYGRTSAPGCPSRRSTVQAGAYLVTPKLGALAGTPIPLSLT